MEGFDRIFFKGHLTSMFPDGAFGRYLYQRGVLLKGKRSAHPPLGAHNHSGFLRGNNSSMRLYGQEGSFSRVLVSQAMGSMPFARAVSSSD
jgi:hypothetical protein